MIKIIEGDLLQSPEAYIIHQCNAQGVMGSGVAKQIATLYPEVETRYKAFINANSPYEKYFVMGRVIYVPVHNLSTGQKQCICNVIGQYNYGRDSKRYTEYRYLFEGILHVLKEAEAANQNIALPYKIGCFRGGGDWDNVVFPFLQAIATDFKGDIVIYKLDKN